MKSVSEQIRQGLPEPNESFYRDLIFNSIDGILLTDRRAMISFASPSITAILGYDPLEPVGRKLYDYVHPEDRELAISTFEDEVRYQPRLKFISIRLTKKTGEWTWCMVRGHNLLDNPHVRGVVIYFTDDTIRRNAEQAGKFAALAERENPEKRHAVHFIEHAIHRQKQLTQATIDGHEKERMEIGKELHDNINQHLTTTRLYLEMAKEIASGPVLEMIHLSHKTLANIITEIRELSHSLVPPALTDIGLTESVQDLCDSLKGAHKFNIGFHHHYFNEDVLPGNMKLMLFRIIQEQMSNIIRHAEADIIRIRLQADAENIILTIMDNGKGFDESLTRWGPGLNNILNRANLFNGNMEIETAPGKGCILSVILPAVQLADVSNGS